MAKKGGIKFEVDAAILSDEEIEAVKLEAQAEAEKEAKDAAKAQLKKRLLREARETKGLEEQHEEVTIDLAPYCDRILLDNVAYLQGVTYTVRRSVAQVMYDTMQSTWEHQSITDGKPENFYRKSRGHRVIPVGEGVGVVNTSQILRA